MWKEEDLQSLSHQGVPHLPWSLIFMTYHHVSCYLSHGLFGVLCDSHILTIKPGFLLPHFWCKKQGGLSLENKTLIKGHSAFICYPLLLPLITAWGSYFPPWIYPLDIHHILDCLFWSKCVSGPGTRFLILLLRTISNTWYCNAKHIFFNYEKLKESELIKALLQRTLNL